jgi:hypothetical protein
MKYVIKMKLELFILGNAICLRVLQILLFQGMEVNFRENQRERCKEGIMHCDKKPSDL